MKKITTVSLVAAVFAVAACGNDVDMNSDSASLPVVETASGLTVPADTLLRTDTTLLDTLKTDTLTRTKTPY